MGLLDALNSDQGLLGLALLSAARAQPVRGTVSDGLLGFREMAAQRDDRKKRGLIQDLQMQEMQAQMQARQAQARAAEQAAARQLAFRQALAGGAPSGGMPMVGAQPGDGAMQMPSVSGGGPASSMPMVGGETQSLAPNWQALALQFPDQIDVLKKLAESGNFGRAEVGRVEDTMVDGRPVRQQFDKFGNPVGAALPQWKAPEKIDTGGQIGMLDPVTMRMLQQFKKTNTPDALLGAQTTMRGQNMADARAREKNTIDRDAVGKVEWKQDVNGAWVGLPKEVSGQGPVTPVTTTTAGKREQQARNAIDIINEAEKLIDKGTGSYIGAGVDLVGKAFGGATPGAVAGGQLKALEGALMMAQPRMEGPQSNMDVQLYRQMAAQIGDPTVPPKIKKAALDTVKALHKKYAGESAPQSSATPTPAAPSLDDLLKKYGN